MNQITQVADVPVGYEVVVRLKDSPGTLEEVVVIFALQLLKLLFYPDSEVVLLDRCHLPQAV